MYAMHSMFMPLFIYQLPPIANDRSPFFGSLIPTPMFTHSFGETSHMGFHCLPFLVRSVLEEELSWILNRSLWAMLSFSFTSLDPAVLFRKRSEAWPSLHEIHVGCSFPWFSLILLLPVALWAMFCALEGLPPMVSAQVCNCALGSGFGWSRGPRLLRCWLSPKSSSKFLSRFVCS